MHRILAVAVSAVALAGCAGGNAMRTSANTVMVQASAAPVCGPEGAARVAAQTAAIETIRAGYTRYVINSGQSQNNVRALALPGQTYHQGNLTYWRGTGTFSGTSTYVPGPVIIAGRHSQNLFVTMYRPGDVGFENALDARQTLGPDWQEKVRNGIRTCA